MDVTDPQRRIIGLEQCNAPGFIDYAINLIRFDAADAHYRELFFFFLRDTMLFETRKHMNDYAESMGTCVVCLFVCFCVVRRKSEVLNLCST